MANYTKNHEKTQIIHVHVHEEKLHVLENRPPPPPPPLQLHTNRSWQMRCGLLLLQLAATNTRTHEPCTSCVQTTHWTERK